MRAHTAFRRELDLAREYGPAAPVTAGDDIEIIHRRRRLVGDPRALGWTRGAEVLDQAHGERDLSKMQINPQAMACAGRILSILQSPREICRMDVATIRRENLRRCIVRAGSLRSVADRTGTDPNYLSTIVSSRPSRNARTRLIRRVESAYGLHPGTLDRFAITVAMAIQALPEAEQRQVIDFLRYKLEQAHGLQANEQLAQYIAQLGKPATDHH